MAVLERTFDEGVLMLTLNRPEALNALDGELRTELSAALELDESVRCLVVAGAGDAFCAGGDVGGIGDATSLEDQFGADARLRLGVHDRHLPVVRRRRSGPDPFRGFRRR